jgi:hypothetical protein
MYGSSGFEEPPEGLIIENYLKRAPDDFRPNRHVKSIVRPAAVRDVLNPHYFRVDGPYVDAIGAPVAWSRPGLTDEAPKFDTCRINHYFTRSRADWAKIVEASDFDIRTWADFAIYDRNEITDDSILRFSHSTRLELMRIRHLRTDILPVRGNKG